jgi:hypothetical protein
MSRNFLDGYFEDNKERIMTIINEKYAGYERQQIMRELDDQYKEYCNFVDP